MIIVNVLWTVIFKREEFGLKLQWVAQWSSIAFSTHSHSARYCDTDCD